MSVEKLFEGDQRCEVLLEAVLTTVYERGKGLPIPSVIGILELAKLSIIKDAENG